MSTLQLERLFAGDRDQIRRAFKEKPVQATWLGLYLLSSSRAMRRRSGARNL
jgi:hypothetical protein